MNVKIRLTKKFAKSYDKADEKVKKAFDKRLELFATSPNHPQLRNHRLTGKLSLYRSINITGDWRALYSERKEGKEIVVIFELLGTHSQLYK